MVHVFTTISRMVCTCVKLTVQLGSSLGTKEELREAAGWSCPRASSLFQSLQLHSSLPSPLLFAEPSPSLWDWVKTKSHCRGGSGLAQPTGRTQSHKCEGLLYSVPLFFLRAMVI